jgi:lipopolysaccharide/colanic/teichoic acid biosynthesis glycosyltransferase
MLKRCFDIFMSSLALLILAFPILILIWLINRKLGSPIFFKQVRPGLHAKPFEMIKFRTMVDAYSANGVLLPNSERVTKFGSFLRSTSLDELPELWNVLKGDMSLVGPRPLLIEYLPLYTPHQARRHNVRPGITGWAQINGRNSICWEQKFNLDIWYVDNQSTMLDFKILLITLKKVVFKEGINASNKVTMERFTGSKKGDK